MEKTNKDIVEVQKRKKGLALLSPEQRKAAQIKSAKTRADKKLGIYKSSKDVWQLTPMQSIKAKCLECCCGQRKEVVLCPTTACPLWYKRTGRRTGNPTNMKVVVEEVDLKRSEITEEFDI